MYFFFFLCYAMHRKKFFRKVEIQNMKESKKNSKKILKEVNLNKKELMSEICYKKNKLVTIISIVLILGIIGFIIYTYKSSNSQSNIKNNNIIKELDKVLRSSDIEIIFFKRDNDQISDNVKKILDTDLKDHGVKKYTTINITNANTIEINYIKEKLKVVNDNCNLYLKVIKGSENIIGVCQDETDKDTIMYYFAKNDLLNDSANIVNEHFYTLGKKALEEGFLGEAKRNFDKCKGYSNTNDLLNDKRFLLLDNEFKYSIENISMNGYNFIFTFKYSSGWNSDSLYIYSYECQGAYACLATEGKSTFYDAKVIGNTIYLKSENSNDYNQSYTIEQLTQNTLKIKEMNFTLKKE